MKKSLVVLTVILASLAVSGVVMAAGQAACPPGPMECKIVVPMQKPPKPKPAMVPKAAKPSMPKCVTVPCPHMQVTVPGAPYAMAEQPDVKMVPKTAPVFRDLCKGASKGKCPIGCGPCAPMITWACSWKTSEECGKVTYMVPQPTTKPKAIDVQCKVVPKPVECYW